MSKYLVDVQPKLGRLELKVENDKKTIDETTQAILKINQDLEILRDSELTLWGTALNNVDACLQKYTKNLNSLNFFKKELEEQLLVSGNELVNVEKETKEMVATYKYKEAALTRLLKQTEESLRVMLEEKARHEKALEEMEEDVKKKYENIKKLELDKYHDAESVYLYKKLSLSKKIKAVDAEIEEISNETMAMAELLKEKKINNRDLRNRLYKLRHK